MEQNGQTVFESMILDTDSAINDTPKDMLDEPSLPRRNSADDVDVSRPRKRPAVMISGDDQNEVDMVGAPNRRQLQISKSGKLTAP